MLVRVDGVDAGEDHRLEFFEAGQRFEARPVHVGDRVADLGVGHVLDIGNDEADFAGFELFDGNRLRREYAHLFDLELRSGSTRA